MKKIIEYKSLVDSDLSDLDDRVAVLIKRGWQPLGGLCANGDCDHEFYYQAIVKYEEDIPRLKGVNNDDGLDEYRRAIDIKERIDILECGERMMGERLCNIDERIAIANDKRHVISENLKGIDHRLQGVEEGINSLKKDEDRLDKVSNHFSEQVDILNKKHEALASMVHKMNSVVDAVEDLDQRIIEIEDFNETSIKHLKEHAESAAKSAAVSAICGLGDFIANKNK